MERMMASPVGENNPSVRYVLERSYTPYDHKLYEYRFTVCGRTPFPFDMMRYDRCWYKEGNIHSVGRNEMREVVLLTVQRARWEPTYERWKSFGWYVKSDA